MDGWMDGWMDGVAVPAISNKMTPIKFRHKKANEGRRMYQQQCSAGHAAAIFTS
jgi:cytochrome c